MNKNTFQDMRLGVDDKGHEYLEYNTSFGPVRDYSPWTIKEYKEWRDENGTIK